MGSLDKFKLYYEEMEKKKVKKPKYLTKTKTSDKKTTKEPLKTRVNTVFSGIISKVRAVVKKAYPRSKTVKKLTKKQQKLNQERQMRAILGIGLLFVVVSIIYSSLVIFNGVDSHASRLMLIPQVIFALVTLFKAFSNIYK